MSLTILALQVVSQKDLRWCLFFPPFPPSIHKAKQTNRWLFASLPTTLAASSTSPNTSLTSQERRMPSDLCWSMPATRFPRMGFKILAFKNDFLKHHTSWGMQKCGKMKESGNIHNCGCMHFWWRRLSEVCTGFYHQTGRLNGPGDDRHLCWSRCISGHSCCWSRCCRCYCRCLFKDMYLYESWVDQHVPESLYTKEWKEYEIWEHL